MQHGPPFFFITTLIFSLYSQLAQPYSSESLFTKIHKLEPFVCDIAWASKEASGSCFKFTYTAFRLSLIIFEFNLVTGVKAYHIILVPKHYALHKCMKKSRDALIANEFKKENGMFSSF